MYHEVDLHPHTVFLSVSFTISLWSTQVFLSSFIPKILIILKYSDIFNIFCSVKLLWSAFSFNNEDFSNTWYSIYMYIYHRYWLCLYSYVLYIFAFSSSHFSLCVVYNVVYSLLKIFIHSFLSLLNWSSLLFRNIGWVLITLTYQLNKAVFLNKFFVYSEFVFSA